MTPRWVRWLFREAAIYGVVALLASLREPLAPAALLPGLAFTGTALAFQLVFWIVGGDPARYRPLMIAAVAEKLAFGIPVLALAGSSVVPRSLLPFGLIDLALGAAFLLAWRVTRR